MEQRFTCPYCWETISVLLEGEAEAQEWIEDCEVCCQPIAFNCKMADGDVVEFRAERAQ